MKKLLLGLGSVASVIAPVAAVISCGVEVSVTETHGGNGTGAVTSTATVDPTLAATVNGNVAAFDANLAATDITKTEKITNFVNGTMHPVTYDYAVAYTLAAKTTGLKLQIGGSTGQLVNMGSVAVKAGDKLFIAIKMPAAAKRATTEPEIHVIMGATDVVINNQVAMKALTRDILLPVFPELGEKLGAPMEVDLGAPGANPMNWTDVLAKIKAVVKPTTTDIVLKLGSSTLEVSFAAGANDGAIQTAVNDAIAAGTGFTNCFDMNK